MIYVLQESPSIKLTGRALQFVREFVLAVDSEFGKPNVAIISWVETMDDPSGRLPSPHGMQTSDTGLSNEEHAFTEDDGIASSAGLEWVWNIVLGADTRDSLDDRMRDRIFIIDNVSLLLIADTFTPLFSEGGVVIGFDPQRNAIYPFIE